MVPTNRKEQSPEDIQELLDMTSFLDTLNRIDLGKLESEKEKALKPTDRMIRDLKANKKVSRYLKGKTAPRKKMHWKQKRRNLRNYYHEHAKPRRALRRAELLTTGEGWYKYLREEWRDRKTPVRMTEGEWVREVYPLLEGRLPVIIRYDSSKPIALENIYVVDTDTRAVLFEGKDYELKKLGYCL
jgi:hypothetical protein